MSMKTLYMVTAEVGSLPGEGGLLEEGRLVEGRLVEGRLEEGRLVEGSPLEGGNQVELGSQSGAGTAEGRWPGLGPTGLGILQGKGVELPV